MYLHSAKYMYQKTDARRTEHFARERDSEQNWCEKNRKNTVESQTINDQTKANGQRQSVRNILCVYSTVVAVHLSVSGGRAAGQCLT